MKFIDKFELDYKNLALKFPITCFVLALFLVSNLGLIFIDDKTVLLKYSAFFYFFSFAIFSFENLNSKFYRAILVVLSTFIFIRYVNISSEIHNFYIYLISIIVLFLAILMIVLSYKNKISNTVYTLLEIFVFYLVLNIFILLFTITLDYFFKVGNFNFGLFLNSLSFIFIMFLLFDKPKKENIFTKVDTLIKITNTFIISYSLLLLAYFASKFISQDDFSIIHLSIWFSLFSFIFFILKEKNNKFIKILILLLSFLCLATILQRIYEYGFTENRIFILFLSLYLVLNLSILMLNKISKIASFLPFVLFITVFIFSPLNLENISLSSQLKIYNKIEDSKRKAEIYDYLLKRNVKDLKKPNFKLEDRYGSYQKEIKFYDVSSCSKFYRLDFYNTFDENNRTFYIKNDDFNTQISETEMLNLLNLYTQDKNQTFIKTKNIQIFINEYWLNDSKINIIDFLGYCY